MTNGEIIFISLVVFGFSFFMIFIVYISIKEAYKKKMKKIGKVEVPQEAFLSVLKVQD